VPRAGRLHAPPNLETLTQQHNFSSRQHLQKLDVLPEGGENFAVARSTDAKFMCTRSMRHSVYLPLKTAPHVFYQHSVRRLCASTEIGLYQIFQTIFVAVDNTFRGRIAKNNRCESLIVIHCISALLQLSNITRLFAEQFFALPVQTQLNT
jgi:hypothetical protein